jgi:transcriptional regulator with XRE-family HTH domain
MKENRIGANVKRLRESHGLTIKEIELSSSQVSLVENGKRQLTVSGLIKLCDKFHIKADKILFG